MSENTKLFHGQKSLTNVYRPVDSWTGMGGMDSQYKLLSELLSDQAAFIASPETSLANYWGGALPPCPQCLRAWMYRTVFKGASLRVTKLTLALIFRMLSLLIITCKLLNFYYSNHQVLTECLVRSEKHLLTILHWKVIISVQTLLILQSIKYL